MINPKEKKKISFRAIGGKAKAVYWHLGVRKALEEYGFKFTQGFGETKEEGYPYISQLIGTSAGSFFCVITAAGYSVDSIIESFKGNESGFPTFSKDKLFYKNKFNLGDYLRRLTFLLSLRQGTDYEKKGIIKNILSLIRNAKNLKIMDFLSVNQRYSTKGIEDYISSELLKGNDSFDKLKADLFLRGVNLDYGKSIYFGKKEVQGLEIITDIPVSKAAAASMALPTVYAPVEIEKDDRKQYFIDGDISNSFSLDVEMATNCDLCFVSSIQLPYRTNGEFNTFVDLGMPYQISQAMAIDTTEKRNRLISEMQKKKQLFELITNNLKNKLNKRDIESLLDEAESILEMHQNTDIIFINPDKNPLLFFGNPFDLSAKAMGRIIVEAYNQTNKVLRQKIGE